MPTSSSSEFCRRFPARGAAIADALRALYFRPGHLLSAHNHREAAREMVRGKQVRCMRLRGTAARAEDIVFELAVIDPEIRNGTRRVWVIRTQDRYRDLATRRVARSR